MPEAVLTEVSDGVAVITINRPEARNAVNGDVARGIARCRRRIRRAARMSRCWCSPARAARSALAWTSRDSCPATRRTSPTAASAASCRSRRSSPSSRRSRGTRWPAVSSSSWPATWWWPAKTAKFGLPEVRRSLVAGAGGLLRLPKRIPYHLAMEIALTGEHFPAARLHQAGLVNQLVPAGEALAAARDLAGRIALGGPLALTATKRVIVESADWDSAEAFQRQGKIITPVFTSADAREGALAFAEKRQPQWRGE